MLLNVKKLQIVNIGVHNTHKQRLNIILLFRNVNKRKVIQCNI